MLESWGMWSYPFIAIAPKVIELDKVPPMGQIELFDI